MSQFIVSARKYRPTRFKDVVGQAHVSQTLKNALQSDHLAHAFLFCGPRGVGKTTNARILAKILNCTNRDADYEACGKCDSCTAFERNASFNITELDAASNNSVEHIRALVEQVRFAPQQGKYKVFIIDEVHMLSTAAFNAFLKTLEEPPSYAIFILATTEKHKIIPTILSRCQIFDFRRIQIPDMVSHLQKICLNEGIAAEPDALHIIAQKADGALRDALSIFDRIVSAGGKKVTYNDVIENLNVLDYDYFFKTVDALLAEDLAKMLLIFDDILKKGFDADLFINGLAEHLRQLLVAKDPQTLELLEAGGNLREKYRQQSVLSSLSLLLTVLNLCNDCDIHYKTARNKRLHVEMSLIKMTYVHRMTDGMRAALEKKTVDLSVHGVKSVPNGEKEVQKVVPKAVLPPLAPTILSIEAAEKVIEKEEKAKASIVSKLSFENLMIAWQKYAEQTPSESTKAAMNVAKVSLEDKMVIAKVGSNLSLSVLQTEGLKLLDFLKAELSESLLSVRFLYDESLAPKVQAVEVASKPTAPRAILLEMMKTNPLVLTFANKMNLKPDID
jgi:DNA polymerase III subunit gamma/tau